MGCFQSSYAREVKLDFEGKLATSGDEEKTYAEVENALGEARRVLAAIEDYKGCLELVRAAMSKPTKENEQKAFEGLLGAVKSVAAFFEFARQLESRIFPMLLAQLAPVGNLQTHQACAKQLAQIFDFTLRFDQTRMMRPNLSNDFSYYRRLLPKFSKHPGVEVKDEEASGMALFTAEHIPMMSTLAKATRSYIDGADSPSVEALLASMANSCMRAAKNKTYSGQDATWLALRAMTGSTVLYDLITNKAFSKNSLINIRDCITILKRDYAGQPNVESLVSAMQYSTQSLKTAPASIQAMFD